MRSVTWQMLIIAKIPLARARESLANTKPQTTEAYRTYDYEPAWWRGGRRYLLWIVCLMSRVEIWERSMDSADFGGTDVRDWRALSAVSAVAEGEGWMR